MPGTKFWKTPGSVLDKYGIKQDGFLYRFNYDAAVIERLKWIPSHKRRWLTESKTWWVHTQYAPMMERILTDHSFDPWNEVGGEGGGDEDEYEDLFGKSRASSNGATSSEASEARTPHAVLYLRTNAPERVVRAAYRALAAIYHPSSGHEGGNGDEERMKQINVAYEAICSQKGWRK